MKLVRDRFNRDGVTIPRYYGRSYEDIIRARGIYYPIPINYIVRYWRKCYWRFLRTFYWVGLVDTSMREEFRWSDFFRIKYKI